MARVALVTGGTRGIGASISMALMQAGYKVAANYGGNDEAANKFKDETGIPVYKFDVSDAAGCEAGIRAIESEHGPVEVLVNNAGITRDGMFHKMTFDQWSAVIRTNLDSMFTCTRPVIDGMRSRNFGRIIIISSINGQKGHMGQANYSAAKAGVIGFAKALAHALDHRPRAGEHGIEVGADDRRPLIEGHLVEHAVPRDAGIVDQDFDGSEFRCDRPDACIAGGRIRDIEFIDGNSGLILEFVGGFIVAAIIRRDRVACFFQGRRDRGSDATSAAGNQCDARHMCLLPRAVPKQVSVGPVL
jgi:hypothetical protein